jgi:hypothetical protein
MTFWVLKSCAPVEAHQRFTGTNRLHLHGWRESETWKEKKAKGKTLLWTVCGFLPNYMDLNPSITCSLYSLVWETHIRYFKTFGLCSIVSKCIPACRNLLHPHSTRAATDNPTGHFLLHLQLLNNFLRITKITCLRILFSRSLTYYTVFFSRITSLLLISPFCFISELFSIFLDEKIGNYPITLLLRQHAQFIH